MRMLFSKLALDAASLSVKVLHTFRKADHDRLCD
jgi:hypothetical protein